MDKIDFVIMDEKNGKEVIEIFNYYIENSFAAYPDKKLPVEFFGKFMEMINGYPAFIIKADNQVVGFCFIKAFHPFQTFKSTAEITYFIKEEFAGKGIGSMALELLEWEASKRGVKTILANISSENAGSINFHRKHGFRECGKFESIGEKFGKKFDVVWMQKDLK